MRYLFDDDPNRENLVQVAKALPLLSELHLELIHKFSDGEIIPFVDELKQVKKIRFQLDDQTEIDDLLAKLDCKWKVSIDPEREVWEKYIILKC